MAIFGWSQGNDSDFRRWTRLVLGHRVMRMELWMAASIGTILPRFREIS